MTANDFIFDIFRFQLAPTVSDAYQTRIDEESLTYADLKSKKNELLAKILRNQNLRLIDPHDRISGFELLQEIDDFFFFAIQIKREIKRTTLDRKIEQIPDYPYIYLIINNKPEVQKIAIQKNRKVYQHTNAPANLFERTLAYHLRSYHLDIVVNPIFSEGKFWDIIQQYDQRIQAVTFEIPKPNLSDVSKTIDKFVIETIQGTNAKQAKLEIEAHKDSNLNINQSDKNINDLVKASSEGNGDITLKIKRRRTKFSTRNIPTEKIVTEFELSNLSSHQIQDLLSNLF
jgi:hypothetical protein